MSKGDKKAPAVEINDLSFAEHAAKLEALAKDGGATAMGAGTPLARDPVQEEMIRQGFLGFLFVGSFLARRTSTPYDDIYIARGIKVIGDPVRFKVIADFVWGEDGEGFNTQPIKAT